MMSYEEALGEVLARRRSYGTQRVPLHQANGRVLAEDICAATDLPRFANAQMDGYAVSAADTPGTLTVRATIHAGDDAPKLRPGEAARIMTGAPLPAGADAVIKLEDVSGMQLPKTEPGSYVRPAGEDWRAGEVLVRRGERLSPAALMVAAAAGLGSVQVERRPRIALVATGNELVMPGEPLATPAQVWCSSTAYLQAYLPDAEVLPIATDDEDRLADALDTDADIVVTTGAVSMGERDIIPKLVTPVFHKVAIRPGKPMLFGERGPRLVFGLPGNPISTAVGYHFFLRPFLEGPLPLRPGRLMHDVHKPFGLRCFLKAKVTDDRIDVLEGQGSHLLRPLLAANAWAVLPEHGGARAGDEITWLS